MTILLEAEGPVSVRQFMNALASELIDVTSAQHLGRALTEEEIAEVCLSSCKGFVISASGPGIAVPRLQLVHFSVRTFF